MACESAGPIEVGLFFVFVFLACLFEFMRPQRATAAELREMHPFLACVSVGLQMPRWFVHAPWVYLLVSTALTCWFRS